MPNTINSAFDVLLGLSVDEALSNPHFLPELMTEALDGQEAQRLFFPTETVNSNVIAWRESTAAYLEDDVKPVAEFGEIPVSDPVAGPLKTLPIQKNGIAIRVSWEQRKDNEAEAVRREMISRANTIIRSEARAAISALDAAPIQELAADTAWNAGGNVPSDFLDAIDLVLGAEDDNGKSFQYVPDLLWINPLTLSAVKRNAEMQKLYVGDMASENPMFKGISDNPLLFEQIQVVSSFAVPKDVAYLAVEGLSGFCGEREPRQITDFYEERGNSGMGGATMSYRSDAAYRRAYGVRHPKSVVKLTGLMS